MCTEEHVFRPFSSGNSGAMIQIFNKIRFIKESPGIRSPQGIMLCYLLKIPGQSIVTCIRHTYSEQFDNLMLGIFQQVVSVCAARWPSTTHPSEGQMEENLSAAQQILSEICRKTRRDIRPNVPRLFAILVRQMKGLDSRSLGTLQSTHPCEKAQKFIADAIPLLGTSASIALMRDLIMSGQVPDMLLDLWVTHMSFHTNINADVLNEAKVTLGLELSLLFNCLSHRKLVRYNSLFHHKHAVHFIKVRFVNTSFLCLFQPLMQMNPPRGKVMLAISSMVNTFCRIAPSCKTDHVVIEISRILEENMRSSCRATNLEEHDLILMSLKSLGNMGNAPQVLPTLVRCSQNEEVPNELRVAAMQAFRRMGCSSEVRRGSLVANSHKVIIIIVFITSSV